MDRPKYKEKLNYLVIKGIAGKNKFRDIVISVKDFLSSN